MLKEKIVKVMLKIWRSRAMPEIFKDLVLYLINKKFIIGVLAVIIDDNNRVLLFHHTYVRDTPWGLPGGAAKVEDLEKALQREIFEESKFKIDVQHHIGVVQWDGRKVDHLFSCSIKDGEFTPSEEVSHCEYFHLDELPRMIRHHCIILDRMARTRGGWPPTNTSIGSFFTPLTVMNEETKKF